MVPKDKYKNQQKFIEARKAEGLERLVLWVKPEDKADLKLIAQQSQAITKLRAKIEAELRRDLEPKIKRKVEEKLTRRTHKAMLIQKRAQARRQSAGSNRPPEMIRFKVRPPGKVRNRLKELGWWYDPVAVVWHLPEESEISPQTERLLVELDKYEIERLVKPLD